MRPAEQVGAEALDEAATSNFCSGATFEPSHGLKQIVVQLATDGSVMRTLGARANSMCRTDWRWIPQARLFVVDRANNRIQIFDPNGKLLAVWKQFSRPSGVYIRDDIIYVADSQSDEKTNPPFQQRIRIGSVKDGKVTAYIPRLDPKLSMPEGVAADKDGNVFGGFVTDMDFKKFAKN